MNAVVLNSADSRSKHTIALRLVKLRAELLGPLLVTMSQLNNSKRPTLSRPSGSESMNGKRTRTDNTKRSPLVSD